MSSILKSEHSKSVCEFRGTNEIHKSNKIKADNRIEYCRCRSKSDVDVGAR